MQKVSLDEIWRTIEEGGFDRKALEETNPDRDTVLRLYSAIELIRQKKQELEKIRGP